MEDELVRAMANLDEEKTLALVTERIKAGTSALEIVEKCKRGVEIVGKRYSEGVYYLSDLIMSEEIFRGVIEIIEPYFPKDVAENGISIVMGTIEGDIHDLGKNIVIYFLRSTGFRVYDLGVDVPPEKFVVTLNQTGSRVLGICVLLTFCIGSIKKVVKLLEEAGMRDRVKVVIGGYPVNQQVKDYTGADYYANDLVKAMEIFRGIASELGARAVVG
ncbi:MAG: cobalamin B12-binding domain-containing protein [Syntrophothermus sp.]|uniref:cobalamin B12-binding domain-containing protein n=1 Tax=Syntrophothermus sp. TaxID=2736299 RepID=UPI00257EB353|nr:cobalamin-dependent protein [Syntrophothermus sp.]NSW84289.1 cobalamin B12-binding domain-containing protein [Syntrophothermus sp.]